MKHHNFLLYQVALDELVVQSSSKLGRRALDSDTGGLERGDLGVGITLTTADNGTSVTHSPTWWGGDTSNEADNRLVGGVVLLQEVGSVFLGRTTNLTNHDDAVSLFVLEEDVQAVNEVGTGEGVTTNTNNEGLTKAGLGSLVDGFVGKSSGARDNTNAAALVDESRHDTNLALAGSNDTGAVGADHTRLALGLEHICDAHHVVLGNSLSDSHNQRNLGGDSLLDTRGSDRWGNEDGSSGSLGFLHSICHILEDGQSEVLSAGLLGVCASNNLCAVFNCLLGVEGSLLSSETLEENLCVAIDAKVLNRLGILRGSGRILPGCSL